MTTARICIFCGHPAGSAEHVFPDWLNTVFPLDRKTQGNAEWSLKVSGAHPATRIFDAAAIANVTSGRFCHECNTGWMSRLESRARPLLLPMITGKQHVLTMDEQITVGAWATKTAMTAETTMPASTRVDWFKAEQCTIVKEQDRPPVSFHVFAAAIAGYLPALGYWCARVRAYADLGPEQDPRYLMNLHVYTISIGTLILQVVRPEPPPSAEHWTLQEVAVPHYVEIPLFPPIERFQWPPKYVFSPDSFTAYTSRGVNIPAGWEVPMPTAPPAP